MTCVPRWLWTLTAALALAATGCVTNPATGKKNLNFISTEDEIKLGNEAAPKFIKEYGGEVPSSEILTYVRTIGDRLAAQSERPNLPWEFHVLDSQVINAFALPGGKVFISRGLLVKMTDEAQLAGVLGHEIGHVTAQHIGQRMSQAILIQGAAAGIGIAGEIADEDWMRVMGVGAGAGGTVYLLKFGRDQESEADTLGVRYMTKLSYNPVGQVKVMEVLKAASGGGSQPEFLSTHPYPETRIKRLNALIQEKYPDYDNFDKYKFHPDRFKDNVLDRLAKLPPPKHGVPKKKAAVDGAGPTGKPAQPAPSAVAVSHPGLPGRKLWIVPHAAANCLCAEHQGSAPPKFAEGRPGQ